MLVSIQHEIDLIYSALISESAMDLHLVPRIDAHQTLRTFKLMIGPEAPVFDYTDWQGNRVHHFSIVGHHDHVVIWANSTVEIHPRRWRLEELEDSLPISRLNHRYQDFLLPHGPVTFDPRLQQFAAEAELTRESRASRYLAWVMASLPELVAFKKSPVQACCKSVPEILTRGHGSAQDYAHVTLSLLRLLGIPGRFVSGYLFRRNSVELDTHAWVEAYVPSVGWVGLDPTQGQLIGDSHVALAVGRDHSDVPPQRGVYRGHAQQQTKTRVRSQDSGGMSYEDLFGPPRVNNRMIIELMLRDRMVNANSLEQQILQ